MVVGLVFSESVIFSEVLQVLHDRAKITGRPHQWQSQRLRRKTAIWTRFGIASRASFLPWASGDHISKLADLTTGANSPKDAGLAQFGQPWDYGAQARSSH